MTQTYTNERTFTVTNAKYIASKVATDLKRIQRFYDFPSNDMIQKFEEELTEFIKDGYLDTVTYGFQKGGNWIEPTLIYKSKDLHGLIVNDDDPGAIKPNCNVVGAVFTSHLEYSSAWYSKSDKEKGDFKKGLPFQRIGAPQPGINGYTNNDRTYSSADRALNRSSVKSY